MSNQPWRSYLAMFAACLAVCAGCPPGPPANNTASGVYNPTSGLFLSRGTLALTIPPGAMAGSVTVTMRALTPADLPSPVPGNPGLVGGVFGPDGLTFSVPASISTSLTAPTITPGLPVLTYDADRSRWVGTNTLAEVAQNGRDVDFETSHFSILGVPDAVPIPNPGDPIGSFLVLSNDGHLETDAISSDSAALLYSEFGDTFNISATHQEVNNEGQIETKAIGLDAILITFVDNYLVAIVGGETSIYNAGQFNEPVLGVVVLSLDESAISASIYAATPDRVIQGTLSGNPQ